MSIFLTLFLALSAIVILLRFHQPIGVAMFAAAILVWGMESPHWASLESGLRQTLLGERTWALLLALYFVMCLEVQLRRSQTLSKMLGALGQICSPRLTLAIMPAFLGLLPSIGGARFSAPIVKEGAEPLGVAPHHGAAINFWFRHVFEFASPIIPGMILGCAIAKINVGDLVLHLFWLSILAFLLGWIVLIRPIKVSPEKAAQLKAASRQAEGHLSDIVLAIAPVAVSVVLMLLFNMSAAVAMGVVVLGMFPILYARGRGVNVLATFKEAFDGKLILNIFGILFFIAMLTSTGTLAHLVDVLRSSALPFPMVVALIAFFVGVLTGMSQGHVAIVMPIVAMMTPGNLNWVGVAMVFGVAGQMLTPTHVCLTLSVDYFKASFSKTLLPVFVAEAILLSVFVGVTALQTSL